MISRKRIRTYTSDGLSEWYCLSTDTKPADPYPEGPYNGDRLLEMDTGDIYVYDGENNTWLLLG